MSISDSREVMILKRIYGSLGVGAGTHTDHHVAQFDVQRAQRRRADANDFLSMLKIGDQPLV